MSSYDVLILTGGILTPKEKSVASFFKKQIIQWRASRNPWLELKIKSIIAEPLVCGLVYWRKIAKRIKSPELNRFLNHKINVEIPELTEVSLATLLKKEGLSYCFASYDDVFQNNNDFQEKLQNSAIVFASSTFLRDLSELIPIIKKIKTTKNRLVVGGALMGTLGSAWQGHPAIDVVAVGYGEFLIGPLAEWYRAGFRNLTPPVRGRFERREHSSFIFSGVPESLSLDSFERPDWKTAELDHQTQFKMIHYESVRGCPYRCAFCNYPYLFDDKKFRVKSAKKMADDWHLYTQEMKIEYISCLDSLFTMPKGRLIEFCNELIRREIRVKWLCYARADDLCDEEVVTLLLRAGCIQVQIGIESGDNGQLRRMNKRTTAEINTKALLNCRRLGLTTVVSLIVGYPGETNLTISTTVDFLRQAPPDFFFLAVFSTRVAGVPVLSESSRREFGLVTIDNQYSVSPYWSHNTMNCFEATQVARELHETLIGEKICLDASLFYRSILVYNPSLRSQLLDLQAFALQWGWWIRKIFGAINTLIDIFFKRDLEQSMISALNSKK